MHSVNFPCAGSLSGESGAERARVRARRSTALPAARVAVVTAALAAFATQAAAQGAVFRTPGMPPSPAPVAPPAASAGAIEDSQTTRFSTEFNPAFSFVIDGVADYRRFDDSGMDDGFDLELRALELGANAWVDPNAWAYFIGATEGEELAIEEAAVHYVGFGGNSTLRAGRFFVDFGKQMQTHVHELRTVERPLVLRAYLGDEVKGDGLQWDDWRPVGEASAVRWSLGVFASLLPEESDFAEFAPSVAERKDFDELAFAARVTGFTELSDSSTLQLGASLRAVPEYAIEFEDTGDLAEGLSSTVYGLDATWGRVDDTGLRRWTAGAELLFASGENGAENPSAGVVNVFDETVGGFYAFGDYEWSRFDSAGLQLSSAELPDAEQTRLTEVEAYYTRNLSEFQRLRFGVSALDGDGTGDSARFVVQYTATLGAHAHGINW